MVEHLELGEIGIIVFKKNIKNIYLRVYPPMGKVQISAPLRMNLETIRIFAISKLDWIKKQQKKLRGQEREAPREYIDNEHHYVWGKCYLLKVICRNAKPSIELNHDNILLYVRPRANKEDKESIFEGWYRNLLKEKVPELIEKWEPLMNVKVKNIVVQKMKTKWGSCNIRSKNIRINTDLAKKSAEFLEYIVVHEMVHLLEPSHNERFKKLMSQFMPKWKFYRNELNRLPIKCDRGVDK